MVRVYFKGYCTKRKDLNTLRTNTENSKKIWKNNEVKLLNKDKFQGTQTCKQKEKKRERMRSKTKCIVCEKEKRLAMKNEMCNRSVLIEQKWPQLFHEIDFDGLTEQSKLFAIYSVEIFRLTVRQQLEFTAPVFGFVFVFVCESESLINCSLYQLGFSL